MGYGLGLGLGCVDVNVSVMDLIALQCRAWGRVTATARAALQPGLGSGLLAG